MRKKVACPVCWRDTNLDTNLDGDSIIALHFDAASHRCDMSYKLTPSRLLRELELEHTAADVLQLAADMRDDIENVWAAVNKASEQELREWLLIALAAVNVNRQPSALFAWVHSLPAAVEAVAA